MPRWDFWWKRWINWFKQNPQNIVPWWAWLFVKFEARQRLLDRWYKRASNDEIVETALLLIKSKKDELVEIAKNEEAEMYTRIIAKELLSPRWFDIILKILERAFWTKVYLDMQNQIANNVVFVLPDNGRDKDIKWQTNDKQKIIEMKKQ